MVGYGCLTLISIINQLYRGSQILSVEEIEVQGETKDLPQVTVSGYKSFIRSLKHLILNLP